MNSHYCAPAAVMLILLRQQAGKTQVLLQKRQHTGVMDGLWDTAATGHVEADEMMTQAVVREAREETGITLRREDLVFAGLGHIMVRPGLMYYNGYFAATCWQGQPFIAEPDKCAALQWFDVEALPQDIIPERGTAIRNYLAGIFYHEYTVPQQGQ